MKRDVDKRSRRAMILYFVPEWPTRVLWEVRPRDLVPLLKASDVNMMYMDLKGLGGSLMFSSVERSRHQALPDDSMVREAIDEAHRNDIAFGAYYCVGWETLAGRENPDWLARTADGESVGDPVWPCDVLCLNTPYRDVVLTHIREMATNYDLDAIWLDMVTWENPGSRDQPSCYCQWCRRKFRAKFGADIPEKPDWQNPLWLEFIQWRYDVVNRFLDDARRLLEGIDPEIPLLSNLSGVLPTFSWVFGCQGEEMAKPLQFVSLETYPDREGYALGPVVPRIGRAVGHGKSVEVLTARFRTLYNDVRSRENTMWELFTGAANGAHTTVWDIPHPDGTVVNEFYQVMGEAYREIRAREPWLGGTPLDYAGIHYSQATKDYLWSGDPDRYAHSLVGTCAALGSGRPHVPYEVIADGHFSQDDLARFSVVVLPNSACLSDDQVEAIIDYVRKGGGLVATYQSSLFDEKGRSRKNFGLRQAFGCSYRDTFEVEAGFIQPEPDRPTTKGLKRYPLVHQGLVLKVDYEQRCEVDAWLVKSYSEGRSKYRYYGGLPATLGERTGYPGILRHCFGKGRVVYVPGLLGDNFHRYARHEFRTILVNAALWAAQEPPFVEVDAPPTISVSHFTSGNGDLLIHLVNSSIELPTPGTQMVSGETLPVFNIPIRVNSSLKTARLVPDGGELPQRSVEGGTVLTLRRLDMWATVVVSLQESVRS